MNTCECPKPKARIVLQLMEAIGHINLALPIAAELQSRGYKVILLTVKPLSIGQKLRDQGFELENCIDAPETSKNQESVRGMLKPLLERFRMGPRESFKATYRFDGACGKYLQYAIETHEVVESKLRDLRPDLIIVDQVIGVPCVTYIAPKWVRLYSGFPTILYSSYNDNFIGGLGLKLEEMTPKQKEFEIESKKIIREKVREFFIEKGAEDWASPIEIAPTSPHLNFYFGPKELGLENIKSIKPLPDYWFRLEHSVGPSATSKNFKLPDKIADHPGKLIYFSLGTIINSDTELLKRLFGFFKNSPNKFIVSTGQMDDDVELYANMWGESYVDQNAVLSRADLFITHGGHNSIMEAFYHGVGGLIVLPIFADQFDSAQRVEDCGFGRRLNPYECSESDMLDCIQELLANEELKERMRSIGERLRSINYPQIAADKIVELLNS